MRPSTYVSYDLHVRHLNRSIGSIALVKLTPNDVRRHSRRLLDEHLSPRSVALNLTVLGMALRQAVDDGLIPRNVAAQVDKPRSVRSDLDILRPLEVKRFMAAARRDKNGALWMVLIGTGIRLGEALGLRWQDLDLADRTMRVSGSVRQVRQLVRTPGEKRLQRVEPKTKSGWRTLALAPTVAAALTKRKAEVAEQPRNVESYVFTSSNGTLLDPRNVDRLFHAFLESAGFTPYPDPRPAALGGVDHAYLRRDARRRQAVSRAQFDKHHVRHLWSSRRGPLGGGRGRHRTSDWPETLARTRAEH